MNKWMLTCSYRYPFPLMGTILVWVGDGILVGLPDYFVKDVVSKKCCNEIVQGQVLVQAYLRMLDKAMPPRNVFPPFPWVTRGVLWWSGDASCASTEWLAFIKGGVHYWLDKVIFLMPPWLFFQQPPWHWKIITFRIFVCWGVMPWSWRCPLPGGTNGG